ncbi:MAG TPA: hypothetical protein VD994_02600, partial [Prosthecobacter sp.]|nr:hypothetical protein [Prosthecobacter sp.]
MKITRTFSMTALAITAAGFLGFQILSSLTPEQKALKSVLTQVAEVLGERSATSLSATVEVLRGEGLPKELKDLKGEIAVAFPDRLRVTAEVDGKPVTVGRRGSEVWAWRADKSFAVRATAGVPVFATQPGQLDATRLEPMKLPFDPAQLAVLPKLCDVRALPDETVDGVACRVLKATPNGTAKSLLGVKDLMLTLWLRADGWPVRVAYNDGKKADVLVALRDLKVGAALPEETWELPAPAGVKVEHVALHHVDRFLDAVGKMLDGKKLPTLGPVTGERKVLATSGNGRLESHDGTRVLFLAGTPEEMGAQHGALLGE